MTAELQERPGTAVVPLPVPDHRADEQAAAPSAWALARARAARYPGWVRDHFRHGCTEAYRAWRSRVEEWAEGGQRLKADCDLYTNDRAEWREREKQRRRQLEREDEAAARAALEEHKPVPKPSKFKPRDPCRELQRQRLVRRPLVPVAAAAGPALAAIALLFGGPALLRQALADAHGTVLATGFAVGAAVVLAVAAVTVLSVFGQVRAEPPPVPVGEEEDTPAWGRIRIGRFFDDGSPIEIPFGDHILIAGATDAGKSTVENRIVAELAPHPEVLMYGIDLKPHSVELGPWGDVLVELAGKDTAVGLLRRLNAEMDRRYGILRAAGRKNWTLKDGPFIKLFVDEMAFLPKPAGVDELTSLALAGRAAGISLVCATQQPEVAVIPQQARGQLRTVIGLRMERAEQARQVFGEAATKEGWDPTMLDPAKRGSVLVRSKWQQAPRPGRSTRITDAEVNRLAEEYARSGLVEPLAASEPESAERRCGLASCDVQLLDPQQKYCSAAHKTAAWRERSGRRL